jgi:transcription elongation factor SPT6
MRNVAAMVPMKNSAWGSGGGGGDANGGWRGDGSNDRDRPFSGRSGQLLMPLKMLIKLHAF